jgi:pSer/pThr/pTyr-binding forkhead associated (FHA) protein
MPIRLVPLDNTDSLPTIIVDRPLLLVGRHGECDVQIRSSKVSRKHCCLAGVEGDDGQPLLAVRDLESTNGTRINGDIVAEGRLKDGDELTIGAFRFRVVTQPTSVSGESLLSCEYPVPILEPRDDNILDSRPANDHGSGGV